VVIRRNRPIKIENGVEIRKTSCEYTVNDNKLFFMDAKTMNIVYCILSKSEFNIITSC